MSALCSEGCPHIPHDVGCDILGQGIHLISAERQRQIAVEGYTPEHDSTHAVRQFVATAVAYLGASPSGIGTPWEVKRSAMPNGTYERRALVKAGALIAAAIDRLDQIEAQR